jgi:hypothetical protein
VILTLGIQQAMRMRHIVHCGLLALHFSTLSHKRHGYRETIIEHEMCLKHFSFQEELREIWYKLYIGRHVRYLLFLYDFNATWIFSTVFEKNTPVPNLMKIRPVGTELFHADRRSDLTDTTKLTVAHRNFANAT